MNANDRQTAARFVAAAYQRHRLDLDRYLTRRLRNRQDVRELAQEVWTRLLRISDPAEILEPLAYIYRTAANVISEFHMRQKRDQVSYDSAACEKAENQPQSDADELGDQVGRQRQFERAMSELPAVYRRVVLMKLRDGLSYQEIGRQLGLATRTVEQYFYRALALVKSQRDV